MDDGDTIIINERGWHRIWSLPKPYAKIRRILSAREGSNGGHWLGGTLRGWHPYPDVGAMHDITVHVDDSGDDKEHQGMKATIAFKLEVERKP